MKKLGKTVRLKVQIKQKSRFKAKQDSHKKGVF